MQESTPKTLGNTDANGATESVRNLQFSGNEDLFQLLYRASSESEGWVKSTKGMNVPTGCVLQVTTQQRNIDGSYSVAVSVTFVPGVQVGPLEPDGGRRLIPLSAPDSEPVSPEEGPSTGDKLAREWADREKECSKSVPRETERDAPVQKDPQAVYLSDEPSRPSGDLYDRLDPGIRFTVKWLHERGFTTTDSGDGSKAGVMEGALAVPHVAIKPGGPGLGTKAISTAHLAELTADLLVRELHADGRSCELGDIQVTHDPVDGSWVIMLYAALEDTE